MTNIRITPRKRRKRNPDPMNLLKVAIAAYFETYSREGDELVRPGMKVSTMNLNFVFLRSGKVLLAIYNWRGKTFIELTPELITKHSHHK